ncbi:MAG TPA: hypothetical protein K8W20_19190, partial [Pseudomonas lactis]
NREHSIRDHLAASNVGFVERLRLFSTKGLSSVFGLVLNLQGSTKTASTGNAIVTINGTPVATIPVAQLGTGLVKLDIQLQTIAPADTYTINPADICGDMGFASAVFELQTVES